MEKKKLSSSWFDKELAYNFDMCLFTDYFDLAVDGVKIGDPHIRVVGNVIVTTDGFAEVALEKKKGRRSRHIRRIYEAPEGKEMYFFVLAYNIASEVVDIEGFEKLVRMIEDNFELLEEER